MAETAHAAGDTPGNTGTTGTTRTRPRLPKRLLAWLAAGAAGGVLLGSVLPPVVLSVMKPVSRDLTVETRTEPSPTVVDGEQGEGQLIRELVTSPGEDRDQASQDVRTTLRFDGEDAAVIDHHVILDRGASLPMPGTLASYEVTVGEESARHEEEVDQPGLRHLFPFAPERRSYPYFDPVAQDIFPLDYVDEVEVGDLDAYIFSQEIEAAPAGAWAELAGDDAEYSVQRVITVDVDTGLVLDVNELIHLAGADQATLFQQQANWDEATKAAQYDRAADLNLWLRVLQVLSWVGGAIAAGFVAAFALVIVRYRGRMRELEQS